MGLEEATVLVCTAQATAMIGFLNRLLTSAVHASTLSGRTDAETARPEPFAKLRTGSAPRSRRAGMTPPHAIPRIYID